MTDNTPNNWTRRDDAMVEDAISRGASRRDLLKMLMGSGVALGAGSGLLLRAGQAVAATPKTGGHMKAAGWSASTADTLDPAKATLSTDYTRGCALYNRLTFLNEAGEIEMELAESIESGDAKTWDVKLRSGVTFHDGKTLSADDVVFSLKRHLDPDVGSKANSIARQMAEITSQGDLNVRIVLTEPNADLPTILSLHHFMIVAEGTTDFSKGIGTGPFKLEEFDPGVRSVAVRNPDYFKETGPYLNSFEFFAISDNNARVNALLSGDVHLAGSVNARSLRRMEGQPHVDTLISTSGNYTNLNIRLDLDPGAKAGFIEGMKYLINRELIQKSVLRGQAEIGNDQPVSPVDRYHNSELKARDYDPDRARDLFEKAGVLGQTIPIIASDAANSSIDMATVLQQAGSEIGMTFDVERVPSDGYWANYWLKTPIHFANINPRPTPDILFSLLYHSEAPWNESQYKSEKFDNMLVEARGLLDESKRTDMYWEMQEMVANDAGTIIPTYISNIDGVAGSLKGMTSNPLGPMMGFAFPEYVWLDE